jgi:AAA15 family ATPase/GTPase
MRISHLRIENFKNLKLFEMDQIPDIIVLGGPNGVGKSSVFEAIGFAKERIQPYYSTQFADQLKKKVVSANADFAKIEIIFQLSKEELEYLQSSHNNQEQYVLKLKIDKMGNVMEQHCPEDLRRLFQISDRKNYPQLGIIEYIDAHRIFVPQELQDIQISFNDFKDRQQRFLSSNIKYNNVKQLLLKLYILDQKLVIKELKKGNPIDPNFEFPNMKKIEKLFEFIPPKEFDDIDTDSRPIKFNIKTPMGSIDLDDLSSGEKEILFVFAELLQLNLNNSIILFDEPDLHLNERIQYKVIQLLKELGNGNQIWISTHSTALINSAENDSIYRIKNFEGENQVARIIDKDQKIELFYDIVGDKSILTLGEKIIFVEGEEQSDKLILERWYDNINDNLVFVNAKSVNNIQKINEYNLSLMDNSIKYNYFFCIRDRDFLSDEEYQYRLQLGNGKIFIWPKYHIENFLINENAIFNICKALLLSYNPFKDPQECFNKLKEIVINHRSEFINLLIEWRIYNDLKVPNSSIKITDDDFINNKNIISYKNKLQDIINNSTDLSLLRGNMNNHFDILLRSGEWKNVLPGKLILKFFLNEIFGNKIKWEMFRNLLTDEVKKIEIPKEVNEIIKSIQKTH